VGYAHIANLYKDQTILMFKEVYASEKIHGTSAHVSWNNGEVHFFAGGESYVNFVKLFDVEALKAKFIELGHDKVMIHGEAYGAGQQRQSYRYGPKLKFIAFDVKVGDVWLNIPNAEQVSLKVGLEFVHYKRVSTDLDVLNAERDAPSEQARRNGIKGDQPREGVVLRPLIEDRTSDGERIVAKHKRAEERETKTEKPVGDPTKLAVLENAQDIANEWVTPTRLDHVLDKLGPIGIERTKDVVMAMVEDVIREGKGEIVDTKDARRAIGKKAAELFSNRIKNSLQNG